MDRYEGSSLAEQLNLTKICSVCSLTLELLDKSSGSTMPHHPNYASLLAVSTNTTCEVCSAILAQTEPVQSKLGEMANSEGQSLEFSCRVEDLGAFNTSYQHLVYESQTIGIAHVFISKRLKKSKQAFKMRVGKHIPSNTRSRACFGMISRWLANCLKSHEKCRLNPTLTMPSCVLDIGDESASMRILVTDGMTAPYTTLSYCWGDSYQPITTTVNLGLRKEHLDLINLPPVFQDAVIMTRNMGYRYLWIDALCILQDSKSDWQAEAMKMDQYYRGSSVNIIASRARNPFDGIFDSADFMRDLSRYTQDWDHNVSNSNPPIEHRAWTLQEELLAPRSVLYTQGFLYWLCNHESTAETCPTQPVTDGSCLHNYSDNNRLFHRDVGGEIEEPFNLWYTVVNDYCRRGMSKFQDRLPGIAGLAKEFGRHHKTHYICGLWREDLTRGLCWYAKGSRITSSEYLGPSWSWISLDSERLRLGNSSVHRLHDGAKLIVGRDTVQVVDVDVAYENQDRYGKIQRAALLLKGWLLNLNMLVPAPFWQDSIARIEAPYHQMFECILDDQSSSNRGRPATVHPGTTFMRLGKWRYIEYWPREGQEDVFGLILKPTGERSSFGERYVEYKRIGCFQIQNVIKDEDDLIKGGWSKQTVSVV